MQLTPTVYFQGICADAIAFYRDALGAQVLYQLPYGGNVDPAVLKPGTEDKILRASLRIGDTWLYVSDGHCTGQPSFQGFSLTLRQPDRAAAERAVQALAEGGKLLMPLRESARNVAFGTVADRYGVHWVIEVPHAGTVEP